jgi:hypothetical protein
MFKPFIGFQTQVSELTQTPDVLRLSAPTCFGPAPRQGIDAVAVKPKFCGQMVDLIYPKQLL